MRSDEIARLMAAMPIFRTLDEEDRRRLSEAATVKTYRADEPIWHAGDPARALTVILRGLVEIRRAAPGGEEALLALFGPRETIGLTALLERDTYPADAWAVSDRV